MRERISSRCASASCWLSLPFFTRLASWRSVTSRAFSRPWSTNFWSTSLRITGRSAAATTWAISPPMTPAPTTAALNTNMALTLASAAELPLRCELGVEAPQRAAQGVGHRAADEEQIHDRREQVAVLDAVLELQRDLHRLRLRLERHALSALDACVLHGEALARAHLVGEHRLGHPAATVGRRVPQAPGALARPVVVERDDVAEAVDPRRP